MSRALRAVSAATAVALGALGTVLVGTAAAANPTCGQTITTSVTLTADVGPCNNGDGLVVDGASNIVINLNGHRVFANAPLPRNIGTTACLFPLPGIPLCYIPADFVGLHVVDSTKVTVQGGTVEGFSAGVAIEGGGANTVRNIVAQNNQGPCVGEGFDTQLIGTYGDGIVILSSANNKILNNLTQNNGPFDGIGVAANTFFGVQPVPPLPTGNQITGNSSQNNNTCFADIGIKIEGPGASNNTVSHNQVAGSFNEGIFLASVNTVDFSGVAANPPTCEFEGSPSTHTVNLTQGSNVVTATQGTFSPNDVGKVLSPNIFPRPFPDVTPITGYISPTQVTIAVNASRTVSGRVSILPRCPILNPLNPSNNNNKIIYNQVAGNGFGGIDQFPGPVAPGTPPLRDPQTAGGIVLRNFCPNYGAEQGMGTLIQYNFSTGNAGTGINVGGCAPNGPNGTFINGAFPGWTNNQILTNVAVDNHPDLSDGNPNCDNNRWFANRYRVATVTCTTTGGTPIAGAKVGTALQGATPDTGRSYPLRKSRKR